jgi:hypothetical protein
LARSPTSAAGTCWLFDRSPGSRNNLVGRLEMLRCDLDTDGRDWLHVGNFTPTGRRHAAKKKRPKL